MAGNDYRLESHWRVQAAVDEVYDLVADSPGLTRWWPAMYLDVLEIQPGDERGVGKVVRFATKGWLPIVLHWHATVTEADRPTRLVLRVWGDFEGTGVWTLSQEGPWVDVDVEWRTHVNKPVLKYLSPLLKPLFAWEHRWAMARGEESLRLEIDRRHTREEDLHLLPSPSTPTRLPAKQIWVGVGLVAAVFVFDRRRRRRRRQH